MKIRSLAIPLLALMAATGCKKEVHLTVPIILTFPIQPGTLDTVKSVLVASASIDDDSFRPDSCQWRVLDEAGQEAPILSGASDTVIRWVPQHEGDYRIVARAFTGKNSVTANAQVQVLNTPASVQRRMVGKWHGSVTTPWEPVYEVDIEFFSNGNYSAHNTTGTTPAFYYGSDDDSPEKTFQVLSLDANGANGNIVIYWWPGNTDVDELKAIKFSNGNTNLNFEFWRDNRYGPVKYALKRK